MTAMEQATQAMMTKRKCLAEELADDLEFAIEKGTDHELALAVAAWMRDGILRHSSTAGQPVSFSAADAIANNLAFGLAQAIRRFG